MSQICHSARAYVLMPCLCASENPDFSSYIKGNQDFPDVDNGVTLLPGTQPSCFSGVRDNLPVFTAERTGNFDLPAYTETVYLIVSNKYTKGTVKRATKVCNLFCNIASKRVE